MDKNLPKTKICIACGIRKPLDDFVVDPTKHLKEYSDICQKCRHKNSADQDDDEGGGGKGKQLNIDYFAKRFMSELHEKWLADQAEEFYNEEVNEEKEEKKEERKEEEKEENKKETEDAKKETQETEKSEENPKKTIIDSIEIFNWQPNTEIKNSLFQKNTTDIPSQIFDQPNNTPPPASSLFSQPSEEKKSSSPSVSNVLNNENNNSDKKTTNQAQEKESLKAVDDKQNANNQSNEQKKIPTINLFKNEQRWIIQENAKKAPGAIDDTTLQTKMFERYAKIETPKQQPISQAKESKGSQSQENKNSTEETSSPAKRK